MKSYPVILVLAGLLAGCQSVATNPHPAAPGDVTVNFQDPDKFTDVRDSFGGGTSQYYLDLLSTHLKETAAARMTAGQKLTITVTDIDLAGDIPPGSTNDVRIIKAIYIPRMNLSFQLKDATGTVLKAGERKLTDLNFQMNINAGLNRNDVLYYDKAMLTDWVTKEFAAAP